MWVHLVRDTGKGIFQESQTGNWPIPQWGDAKALRTCQLSLWALLLEEVVPTYSQTISTWHSWPKLKVSCCLLVKNVKTHARMGGAGNRGKVREKTKGFPVMSHCLLGNNFRSHHNIPSTCPRRVCCAEIQCGERSTEPHLRADRPHRGQKSRKEPGQARHMWQFACRLPESPSGETVGGLKTLSSSPPFL